MLINKKNEGRIFGCVEYVYMLRSGWEENNEEFIFEHVEPEVLRTHLRGGFDHQLVIKVVHSGER